MALQMKHDNLIRSTWKAGSYCEVYSNTSQSWHKAHITNIFTDTEGEWLGTQYTVNNHIRCREVPRFDSSIIRPILPSKPIAKPSPFGHMQSPINIITSTNTPNKVKPISDTEFITNPLQFNYPSKVMNCSILNNGHTVQINVDSMNKCSISIHNKVYELKQFHFHTPSEHTIDSMAFDMEMHLVHMNKEGDIAVLGFIFNCTGKKTLRPHLQYTRSRMHLFIPQNNKCSCTSLQTMTVDEEDEEEQWKSDISDDSNGSGYSATGNEFLDQFWSQLPRKKTVNEIPLDNVLSFDYLFETASNNMIKSVDTNEMRINMDIFEYEGSLTTPPYTEGVQWLVSKKTHFINKEELNTLSSCWNHENNARPVQDYFGRTVSLRCKSDFLRNL